jgi:imidazolonepropionase-like amidohydrolase
VIDGYARVYESVRTGRPPVVDDPNGCVDSLTFAHIASTPALGAGRLDRSRGADPKVLAERHRIMAANLVRVYRAGIPIAMGTDAGNPLTLHGPAVYAEMEAMQAAGLSPMAVIVASTRGGALAMGKLDEFGTVQPGKAADLLVVAADPLAQVANLRQIRYVIRGGEVRPLDELRVRR